MPVCSDGRRFRRAPGAREAKGWIAQFELGAAASGIFRSTAAALFFPHADVPHQMFIVFVLAGMCAGAMTACGAMRGVISRDRARPIHYSMAILTMDRTISDASDPGVMSKLP